MKSLKTNLHSIQMSSFDQLIYWSAFTMAFSGALRASEFASPTIALFDADRTLMPSAIAINTDVLRITLRRSKTDQFGEGYSIALPATGRSVCPLKAYLQYADQRKQRFADDQPFFILENGHFLTRRAIDKVIHQLLPSNSTKYSSHSFRIGAATTAASNGATEEEIKLTGRWKSAAFARYVRTEVPLPGFNPYS
jgi:hypothetical protein